MTRAVCASNQTTIHAGLNQSSCPTVSLDLRMKRGDDEPYPIALDRIMTELLRVSSEMSQGIINLAPQPILAVVQLCNRLSSFYHILKYTPLSGS
jgi:hypothetical protein